jgi:hydroxymethylglutaryl-CoA lyase
MHVNKESGSTKTEGERHSRDVIIVEVGPRDGLQNEAQLIPTDVKVAFIDALSRAGLPVIEATSFVNPKAVPQLADADLVMAGIQRSPGVSYPCLVPNERGYSRARAAGATEIALFTAATDEFASANVGTTIDGTFTRFAPVLAAARDDHVPVRGYVSVAFGCPYAGAVEPLAAITVAQRLFDAGCAEVSLADTIGAATPDLVNSLLMAARDVLPQAQLAMHFHDTSGTAIANVETALEFGVRIFDSAVGGLGGCPFAPGAPGNLSTERLVARLDMLGLRTGVDLGAVSAAAAIVAPYIPRLELEVA